MSNLHLRDKLISNTSYLFLNWFAVTVIAMLYWIIIGKTLSPSSYGIIATSTQIITAVSYVSMLGFTRAVGKLVPEFIGKNMEDKAYRIIVFSLKIIITSAIIFGLILLLSSTFLSSALGFDVKVIAIISVSIIFASFSRFFECVLYGLQKMKKLFLTETFGEIVKIIVATILIIFGFNYFGPLIGFMLSFLIVGLLRVEKKFFVRKKAKVDRKLIIRYALPAFCVDLFTILFNNTQFIILSLTKGIIVTGLFAVASKISFVIPLISGTFAGALYPITSLLSAKRNAGDRQAYLIRLIFRYSILFTIPAVVFLTFFSKYMVLFFSSSEFIEAALILPILAISGVVFGLGTLFRQSLYAIKRPKEFMNSYIASTIVYLVLVALLTYYFSSIGLALAYLMSGIFLLATSFNFIRKHLRLELNLKDVGMVVAASLMFVPLILLIVHIFDTSFIISVFEHKLSIVDFIFASFFTLLTCLAYVVPVFIILIKMNFYIEEDLLVLEFLRNRMPMFKGFIGGFKKFLSRYAKRSYK